MAAKSLDVRGSCISAFGPAHPVKTGSGLSMGSHAPDCVGDVPFLSLEHGLYSETSES